MHIRRVGWIFWRHGGANASDAAITEVSCSIQYLPYIQSTCLQDRRSPRVRTSRRGWRSLRRKENLNLRCASRIKMISDSVRFHALKAGSAIQRHPLSSNDLSQQKFK